MAKEQLVLPHIEFKCPACGNSIAQVQNMVTNEVYVPPVSCSHRNSKATECPFEEGKYYQLIHTVKTEIKEFKDGR